ncbi:MAG: class I SAM-dependent methyltransferase [Geobacteraceae bacterium]|nr:class I SAM-dependent methyltransferase [Geobacteraceae bacterium]
MGESRRENLKIENTKVSMVSKTDRDISLASQEFIWDGAGPSDANLYIIPSIDRLLQKHGIRKILDLGCGNGYIAGYLAKQGYEVTGCDYSQSGIELAMKQFPDVLFFQQDLGLPLPEEHLSAYDAVISTEVIEHLLLPRKLMENALNALKPNGILIVSAPYHGYLKNVALALTNSFDRHWHPLRDYGHIKFFSLGTLTKLFEEFKLKNIRYETVGRIPAFAKSMILSGQKE